ncbi:MAG: hypothetical protein L0220_03690 [Acidobacteria bacterium]|nr:hypothetical protein [Acidobacteriota bacterium]
MTKLSESVLTENQSDDLARTVPEPYHEQKKYRKKHDPYTRVGRLLGALDKLQEGMTVEMWQVFIPDYARHYLHSLKLGEHPMHPWDYFNEWMALQRIGQTPPDTDKEPFYNSRNFIQYESPKGRFWL